MRALPSFKILSNPSFARFLAVRSLATLAVQIQTTAMGWQLYDAARRQGQAIEAAALMLGLVGLVQFLPLLTLSLHGGQAADRHNRKLILLACLGIKAAVAAGLTLAAGLGADLVMPAIFLAAFVSGATNAFMPPAATALMPMLLPRADLPEAVAWSSLTFNVSLIIGPALGGLLYGAGPATPYFSALALLAFSAALLARLSAPREAPVADTRPISMIAEGLRFVWSNKIVLGAISLDLVVVLLAGAVALLPVFARDILHAGPSELGVLRASMGVGAALVAISLVIAPIRTRVGVWMFGATIAFGVATIAFGLSRSFWLTACALAFAGGADMISVYIRQSLIQLATPDEMRGRVGAVSFVFISASNELGDFEAGLTARILGPVMAVVVGGTAAITASLAWTRWFPALVRADGFEPVPPRPRASK